MPISYENLNTLGVASTVGWASQSMDEKAFNFAAATVVDIGTSIWNSVTPEAYNVSTAGVLQDMGAVGAVAAYEMNKDTVETLSFIGGLFIPGLAATKIARGVRAGLKGTNWLSDARHLEDMNKFNKLIEGGMQGTQQYKALRNSMFLRGQASNMMDVAAAELAIAGALSAHPYMEHYWEDPVKNFGISMLIGGGIGGGISALVTRSQLKAATGAIESAAVKTVQEAAAFQAPVLSDTASAITALDVAAQRLDKLASAETANQLTRDIAKSWATSMKEQQGALFTKAATPDVLALSSSDIGKVQLQTIRDTLKDPKFFGVDKVGFFKADNKAFSLTRALFRKDDMPTFKKKIKSGPNEGKEVFISRQYYSQELGGFMSKANADLATSAADVYKASDITAQSKRLTAFRAKNDFDPLASTADLEASYLANLNYFNTAKVTDLKTAKVVAGDLPAIHGWASAVNARLSAAKAAMADPTRVSTAADLEALKELTTATLEIRTAAGRVIKATPEQAHLLYLSDAGQGISQAVKGGMPREVAAMRFNTTPDIVDAVVHNPEALTAMYWAKGPELAMKELVRWTGPESIEAALAPTRRILQLSATEGKMTGEAGALLMAQHEAIKGSMALSSAQKAALESGDSLAAQRVAAKAAVLDEQYAAISRLWIETSVAASRSPLLASMLNQVVDAQEIKVLREGLSEMVNGKGGNPLFQSGDFVTSMMGRVGQLITGVGDRRARLANQEYERLATPISTNFNALLKDPAARTQFALFDNFRQSTRGLLKYDPESKTFLTKDPNGDWVRAIGAPTATLPVVDKAMKALDDAAVDVYTTQATLNRIKGGTTPADIGTWIPSVDLRNKHRGFVVNHDTGQIKLLVANTADDLKTLMGEYKAASNETLMTAAEVGASKIANMSDELMQNVVTAADVGKLKKGIGLAAPDVSGDRLAEILNGLRDRINYQATTFVETSLQDVMTKLDYLSSMNQKYVKGQGSKGFLQAVKQLHSKDTAADVKDLLLGRNPVHRNQFMGLLNQGTSATLQVGINAFSKSWELVKPSFLNKGTTGDYEGFIKALEAQGIKDPFGAFHEAARPLLLQRAKNSGYSVSPDRLINGGNALAASLALRFGELAQPLVNMMSLPILSISTISRSVKAANMSHPGQLLEANPLAVMMNGVRRSHSTLPENQAFLKMFKEEGLLDPILSEADEVMRLSRMGSGGVVGGVERLLDSTFVKVMSKPADVSETMVRKYALMTGVELGRRLYGSGASQRQIAVFARDFMKQSIGNYSTSQRPMMFQGSLGAAAGLFQTYMLTYAQNMYRHIELADYKGLGKTMLAQAGIFGVGSLPGFQPISQAIGEHFSDEHWDLVSGTYRAIPDQAANLLLYGMPSNIAPDVHTRGDVNPRVPGSVSTMVAPSMVGQALETMFNAGKALAQADVNAGQAFMEALSMQSVSRPIARASELVTGTAVTRQGNQVAGSEEVWSWQGVLARVFSTRTLQESKVREAMHLNSYYGSIDNDNRNAVLERLRTAIRADNLDSDTMDELAYEYLRTGSPQGFRQAVTKAFMETDNPGLVDLTAKLRKSPLMNLIEDID